jgi:uncharacterized protein (DUF849 family)
VRPEIAACNAGSLNYLKVKADGSWAWPPLLFDNPVAKVKAYLDVMARTNTKPEFRVLRHRHRALRRHVREERHDQWQAAVQLRHGRRLRHAGRPGAAADPDEADRRGLHWQVTAIGRAHLWALHARAAELGGHLRTGLEDTFYLPDGRKARSNGELVAALADCARAAGRAIASPAEARVLMGLSRPPADLVSRLS